MFNNYLHKLGVGCMSCNHIWLLLSNDKIMPERLQVKWAQEVLKEHEDIHAKDKPETDLGDFF